MKDSPCHGCIKRNVTATYNCHSHCKDYKDYCAENKVEADIKRERDRKDYLEKCHLRRIMGNEGNNSRRERKNNR